MTTLSRRGLLAAGAALSVSLAGCPILQNLTPSQLQKDVGNVTSGLEAVVAAIAAAGIEVPSQVQKALDDLRSNADKIAAVAELIAGAG